MKKLTFTIIALISFNLASAQLWEVSKEIKLNSPKVYEAIKEGAIKSRTSQVAILAQINAECTYYAEYLAISDLDTDLFNSIYNQWTPVASKDFNVGENPSSYWMLIIPNYKNEVKAK